MSLSQFVYKLKRYKVGMYTYISNVFKLGSLTERYLSSDNQLEHMVHLIIKEKMGKV